MLNGFGKIQNIVLVGSTSEIGLAIIKNLPLATDSHLVLLGKSHPTAEEKTNLPKVTETKLLDLRSEFDSVKTVASIFPNTDIDVVIFAAGILGGSNQKNDTSTIELFEVNLVSQIRLLLAFSERLKQQRHGKILVISSVSTLIPRKHNYLYGSSKVALDFFSQGLMRDLQPYNVKLTILRPGFVFTKMTAGLRVPPFAAHPQQVGLIGARGLRREKKIVLSLIHI